MNLKKIIIYRDNVLFEILNEIKEILNFDLTKVDEINFKNIEQNLGTDILVISKSKIHKIKNQLVITQKPIKLEKLFELINLKFLKEKFSYQSNVSVGSYKLNLNSREMNKDNKILGLTEREINLVLFLKKSKSAVKINELQKKVWEYGQKLETHTVETHIYRLRKKIKEKFNDDEFIISSKEGYLIN